MLSGLCDKSSGMQRHVGAFIRSKFGTTFEKSGELSFCNFSELATLIVTPPTGI